MLNTSNDTNSIIENNLMDIYNSSEWKPISFVLVEYPKGKLSSLCYIINNSNPFIRINLEKMILF